jgi:hypothetical protein
MIQHIPPDKPERQFYAQVMSFLCSGRAAPALSEGTVPEVLMS